jgi:demethylmenaquinone methyltransferase/2-methoxy-6-polyprenyl-1,4-benzoquinol methylase
MWDDGFDDLLAEQSRYYDARAAEYDDWFYRRGRYDRGAAETREWFHEVEQVKQALAQLPLDNADLLELAPGTGIWTQLICSRAKTVTAIDASIQMVEVAKNRLGLLWDKVAFVQDDLFKWKPSEHYDGVVFCFWISHVPVARFDAFIQTVASAIRPGGFVFFLDSRRDERSTAVDHVLPDDGQEKMVRRLDDGREFSIFKNFWSSADLVKQFAQHGVALEVHQTSNFFQFGIGRRALA